MHLFQDYGLIQSFDLDIMKLMKFLSESKSVCECAHDYLNHKRCDYFNVLFSFCCIRTYILYTIFLMFNVINCMAVAAERGGVMYFNSWMFR